MCTEKQGDIDILFQKTMNSNNLQQSNAYDTEVDFLIDPVVEKWGSETAEGWIIRPPISYPNLRIIGANFSGFLPENQLFPPEIIVVHEDNNGLETDGVYIHSDLITPNDMGFFSRLLYAFFPKKFNHG